MVEATLKFNLPEETNEHRMAIDAGGLQAALFRIREKVFHQLDEGELPNSKRQVYREVNNMIIDEIRANGIEHLFD